MTNHTAKDLHLGPISSKDARRFIKRLHYSGRVVNTSVLHLGVFLCGRLEGVMQFGPPMVKKNMLPLVAGTSWNGMIELNRMAFSDRLPRNSESRAISVAIKIIKKHYPNIEWIVSFADGCQCGDGTIYRASGFNLVQIKKNNALYQLPDGRVINNLNMTGKYMLSWLKKDRRLSTSYSYNKNAKILGAKPVVGYQLKYVYFLNKDAKKRLTVPILPFSEIDKVGAGMYKGQKKRVKQAIVDIPINSGGATPTDTLQVNEGA